MHERELRDRQTNKPQNGNIDRNRRNRETEKPKQSLPLTVVIAYFTSVGTSKYAGVYIPVYV